MLESTEWGILALMNLFFVVILGIVGYYSELVSNLVSLKIKVSNYWYFFSSNGVWRLRVGGMSPPKIGRWGNKLGLL